MIVRPATIGDAARIAALAGQLGYPSTEAEIVSRLDCLLGSDSTAIYIAEESGAVVGWIAVRSDLVLESGSVAEIVGLVVDEAHRGASIGATLTRAAEAWARERGHLRVRVRSNVLRERAHAFYRRLGYAIAKQQAVFDKKL